MCTFQILTFLSCPFSFTIPKMLLFFSTFFFSKFRFITHCLIQFGLIILYYRFLVFFLFLFCLFVNFVYCVFFSRKYAVVLRSKTILASWRSIWCWFKCVQKLRSSLKPFNYLSDFRIRQMFSKWQCYPDDSQLNVGYRSTAYTHKHRIESKARGIQRTWKMFAYDRAKYSKHCHCANIDLANYGWIDSWFPMKCLHNLNHINIRFTFPFSVS